MDNDIKVQQQIDDLQRRVILLENLIVSMLTNNTSFASEIIKEATKKKIKNGSKSSNTVKEKMTLNRRRVLI